MHLAAISRQLRIQTRTPHADGSRLFRAVIGNLERNLSGNQLFKGVQSAYGMQVFYANSELMFKSAQR
jgi:hypothetical protein